jgi:hypothetical protein
MHLLLFFAVVIILGVVSWEDFVGRAVHAILFPLVLILSIGYSYQSLSIDEILFNVFISGCFLFVQAFALITYFMIKHKRWVNITNDYLGWGDVLFLLAILPFFSPVAYLIFYLASLILTIIIVLLYRSICKNELKYIPLAGIQSVILIVVLTYHQFVYPILYSDLLSILAV